MAALPQFISFSTSYRELDSAKARHHKENQISIPSEFKMVDVSNEEKRYDYIVVGADAAGSVLAAELSASGAQVLVVESGVGQNLQDHVLLSGVVFKYKGKMPDRPAESRRLLCSRRAEDQSVWPAMTFRMLL
jgi:hypothetical protein